MKYYQFKNQCKMFFNSKLIKSVSVYTITNVANAAIPFMLLPILTRHLTPGDYGITAMFGVIVSFVAPFIGLSVYGAIARSYYDKERIDIKAYISNALLIIVVSALLVSFLFVLFSKQISQLSSFPSQFLWVVIAVCFGQAITRIVLVLWQVQVQPFNYGVYQISQTLLNAGLSVFLVVNWGMGWQGRIGAQLVTVVLFLFIGAYILVKNGWIKFELHPVYLRDVIKFGTPLIPHALGGVIMTMTDKFFITNMIGLEATGLYAVGYQLGTPIMLFADAFNKAYVPWLYGQLKKNDLNIRHRIVNYTYLYFIMIIGMAMGLTIMVPLIFKYLVGSNFSGSEIFVFWIVLGFVFKGMYLMVCNFIFYVKKTAILAWITFASAIVNVGLNYFLIKSNGAIGAAQATTLTSLFFFLLTWYLSSHVFEMPWSLNNRKA